MVSSDLSRHRRVVPRQPMSVCAIYRSEATRTTWPNGIGRVTHLARTSFGLCHSAEWRDGSVRPILAARNAIEGECHANAMGFRRAECGVAGGLRGNTQS